jgi:hypothetical protein
MGLYHYLCPNLFPLFPEEAGSFTLALDLDQALAQTTYERFTGTLDIKITQYTDGQTLSVDQRKVEVKGGNAVPRTLRYTVTAHAVGYIEVEIECAKPVFSRIQYDAGYALYTRPGYGTVTVIPDVKFASPRIIQQMKVVGKFCMQHQACFVDHARDIGNSVFVINPYSGPLLIRLIRPDGKRLAKRVSPKSASVVALAPLLDDGQWTTVMIAANNRFPVYDVRHPLSAPLTLSSIDHLDPFSGFPTHLPATLLQFVRGHARRILRETGIRYP